MTKPQLAIRTYNLANRLKNKIEAVSNQISKLNMLNHEANVWLMNHEVATGGYNASVIKAQQKAMDEMYRGKGLVRIEDHVV